MNHHAFFSSRVFPVFRGAVGTEGHEDAGDWSFSVLIWCV
uniref:Uncharacterized protein n=1 Tax=Anguilla anguilla TaxID=7936 RepID=A0A0E9WLF7_ANGAN